MIRGGRGRSWRCGIPLCAGFMAYGSWAADPGQSPPAEPAAKRPSGPLGFPPGSRARELGAGAVALAVPTPANARKWLKTLTEEPHVAGTPADYKTAVFVRDMLREWGWKADL